MISRDYRGVVEVISLGRNTMAFLAHLTTLDFPAITVAYFLGVGSGVGLTFVLAVVARKVGTR